MDSWSYANAVRYVLIRAFRELRCQTVPGIPLPRMLWSIDPPRIPECFSAKILHASPSIYWLIWHVGHFLSLGDMQAWPWLSRGSPRKVCPAWKPPTFLKDWRIYKILSKHLKGRFGLFVGLVRMYVHTSYFIHHVIQGMYLAKDKINPRVQQPLVTYIVV